MCFGIYPDENILSCNQTAVSMNQGKCNSDYSEFNSHLLILFSTSDIYLRAMSFKSTPAYVSFRVAQLNLDMNLEHFVCRMAVHMPSV